MKNHQLLLRRLILALGLGVGLSCSLTASVAQAQPPEGANAPIPGVPNLGNMGAAQAQRIQQWLQNITPEQRRGIQLWLQNMTPEQQRQMAQQTQQWLQNMAPEQRQQMREQIQRLFADLPAEQQKLVQDLIQTPDQKRESWVRQVIVASGFKDVELQNDIVAFIQAQEKARAPLRSMAFALSTSLVNPALTDEQLKTTWAGFRDAMAKDQERYKTDLAALDEKIKYSTQPRLEMMLGVLGITEPETATLGGVGAIFPNSGFGSGLMTDVATN